MTRSMFSRTRPATLATSPRSPAAIVTERPFFPPVRRQPRSPMASRTSCTVNRTGGRPWGVTAVRIDLVAVSTTLLHLFLHLAPPSGPTTAPERAPERR